MTKINRWKETIVTRVEKHKVELSRSEMFELLTKAGYEIPNSAEIFICIPGGGDWSNTSLDIDDDHPVTITWQKEDTITETFPYGDPEK